MRNRAKCKRCKTVIESVANIDLVTCQCGEIAISGGNLKLQCFANDFSNFLRIGDDGKEIEVQVKEKDEIELTNYIPPATRKQELVQELEEMCKNIENLPRNALHSPVTNADLGALSMILLAIFKSEN